MLAGDRGRHHLAALVVGLDFERGRPRRVSKRRACHRSSSYVGHLYFFIFCSEFSSYFGIPVRTLLPYRGNLVAQLLVGGAAPQEGLEVVAGLGEQAGEERG